MVLKNLARLSHQNIAYLPLLLEGVQSSADGIRAKSIFVLGTPTYASPEVTAILRNAVSDSSVEVRRSAIYLLVHGGDRTDEVGTVLGSADGTADVTMALLLQLAKERWSPEVRRLALLDLGETKSTDPEVIAALTAGLKDGNADVRLQAAESIALMGERAEPAKATLLAIWNASRVVLHEKGEDSLDDDTFFYEAIREALWHLGVKPPAD